MSAEVRCDGCACLADKRRVRHVRMTNSRGVDYCGNCEALRQKYNILAEDHEQYRLHDVVNGIIEDAERGDSV